MINHLLKQDCDIVKVERDRYGDVTESDPIPAKCRAKEKFEMVMDNAGEEVVSSIEFWFNPGIDIELDNLTDRRIKYQDKSYTPISVTNRRNTLGESVMKVVNV